MSSLLADPATFRGLRPAGGGATSVIFRGRDERGVEVACKVARDRSCWGLIEDEAQRLAWLDAPGLPELRGVGRWAEGELAGAPFLVLGWLAGRPLRELLGGGSGALASIVASGVGGALEALERAGLAHGDVKPENILVDEQAGRAWLLDLGLGGEASAGQIAGGTRRYLAPEALAGQVVERRFLDRFALGEVLQEAGARGELLTLARALSSPTPQARPAVSLLPGVGAGADAGERRAALVRSAYARTRRGELQALARAAAAPLDDGLVAWAPALAGRLRAVAELRGDASGDSIRLAPLDLRGRQRWLSALVGPAAAAWPAGQLGDEGALGAALERLARAAAPGGWTFAQVSRALGGDVAAPAEREGDDIELALALARPDPSDQAIEAAERRLRGAGGEPASLGAALAEALRRRGQPERALLVPAGSRAAALLLAQSEAARRSRCAGAARALAEAASAQGDAGQRRRARAIEARLLHDEGRYGEALAHLPPEEDAAGCEVKALCLWALGRLREAREAAERGLVLAVDDEGRARLSGALGYVAHAQGDARAALAAYAEAARAAARAGAVVEEATYRTGEAACAVDAGELEQGVAAAQRAAALWDALGRAGDGARALLSHAAALRVMGAHVEARRLAGEARAAAEEAGDGRAGGYARLVALDAGADADASDGDLERAGQLLSGSSGDELRWAARALARGRPVDLERHDARGDAPAVARIEWWGARAAAQERGQTGGRADEALSRLVELCEGAGPVASRGEAAHAGRRLALARGDAGAARRLGAAQREAATRLLAGCPLAYRAALLGQPWVIEASLPGEGQSGARVEAALQMVRALSSRDRLRPLLAQIVDALILWTGVERGLLLMPAPGGKLVPRVARNLSREALRGEQLWLSTTLAARALSERRPVVATDAAGESSDALASVHALRLRSVLAVPLLARGEALGVVYLDDRVRRGAFGPEEIGWVDLVAGVAAVALADARDQVLLRRAARKARRAEEALAASLARREDELDALERSLPRAAPTPSGRRFEYGEIVGASAPLERALRLVDRVAPVDLPVLVLGETGTGKELFARAIHRHSRRAARRFLGENCGAMPESLLESELFGHAKGAFTGADRARVGLFELADGGTLFLDEVGEMSPGLQARLLRVLQEGEVRPVGGSTSRRVDVRVVAATHRDLAAMVREGKFREDLYFRLRVVEVRVPPLRERPDDIPLLVKHFLSKHGEGRKIRVSAAAIERLTTHAWPGNIRQLENVLRAAIVLSDGTIERPHLGLDTGARETSTPVGALSMRDRIDALESEMIREALAQTSGNQSRAAELLGVSRFGLQKMIRRLKIP